MKQGKKKSMERSIIGNSKPHCTLLYEHCQAPDAVGHTAVVHGSRFSIEKAGNDGGKETQ